MLFSVGTRVKFLHSKDEGIVTALLSGDMVNVMLDEDDMEIPAFIGDLVRAEDYIDQNPSVKAKIIPGKIDKTPKRPELMPIENQYAVLKSKGIQLAFDPQIKADAMVDKYKLYLINDTKSAVIYDLKLELRGSVPEKFHGKLDAMSYLLLREFLFDELNDAPNFHCECRRITTAGTGPILKKNLKIKPKQFFKKQITAPFLNRLVHLFVLFDQLNPEKPSKNKEDLKSYTQRNAKPIVHRRPKNNYFGTPDINEVAAFSNELDLHIEKIAPEVESASNREILQIQLDHFDQFIAKAIRYGISRVFVIHGVGKGRLRNSIASRLIQMPEVESFKNEFHPRYGYGATEIFLKI